MYASGTFDFPTSTGDFDVDLPFDPQGVILIGSNKATSGSLLTGQTAPGFFFSMNALEWDDPSTVLSFSLSPNGNSDNGRASYRGIETGPISMQPDASGASSVEFKASAITFGTLKFTLTVATAAPGVRPVHWFAWGGDIPETGVSPIALQTAMVKQNMVSISPTFDAGFEAWSAMVLSTIAGDGFGEGANGGECWFSFGTGHYPEDSAFDAQLWKSSVVYTQIQLGSPLGRQGFNNYFVLDGPGSTDWGTLNISDAIGAIGPILTEGYRRHRPHAEVSSMSEFINEGGGSANTFQGCIWWNSEGWTDFVTIPEGGSVIVPHPSNFQRFEQVMFSTINEGGDPMAGIPLRYGMGMLGYDDQGCVALGADGSFYQSNDECVAHCTASGYKAAAGELLGGSFRLTRTDSTPGDMQVVWHGWGSPAPSGWLPEFYRRVRI